ncbi:MAG TPA: signal peptidase II [Pyrinomonadaceae bacterium]|nr:signal peptidase II [Pyrinomonadaceae bacterium]
MKNKEIWWRIAYLGAALGVFLLDQASKAWARKSLRFGDSVTVIPDFLNFIYAENPGIAFSQFQNGGDFGRWALSALAGLAALAVFYYFWRTKRGDDRILSACALLLAGILGNLTDRVRLGFVIDFIDVQFGNWHYPTFNVADAAICIGAGLLILDMFFFNKKQENSSPEASQK